MPLTCTRRKGSPIWWISGRIAGVRIRESTGTDRRELAEEFRATREASAYRAVIHGQAPTRRTFSAVADSYVQHGGPHAAPTIARLAKLSKYFGAATLADDIDQAALDKACAKLLRPNPAPATRLREIIAPVRAVLTHGARRRMCAVPMFDPGRASRSRTDWLRPAEVDAILASAARHLQPLIIFLAGTGARLSEALNLDWADVDMTHARATLRETKNGRDRIVDLCPRVLAALEADSRPPKHRKAPLARTGRVFRTYAGEPYAERQQQGGGQIKSGWHGALQRAGITRSITPHGLRHTWASWHYAVHRDPLLLRDTGGWKSISQVERYAHLTPPGMAVEIEAWRNAVTFWPQGVSANDKTQTKSTA